MFKHQITNINCIQSSLILIRYGYNTQEKFFNKRPDIAADYFSRQVGDLDYIPMLDSKINKKYNAKEASK